MSIDEAIAHAREVASEQKEEVVFVHRTIQNVINFQLVLNVPKNTNSSQSG